MRAVRAGSGLRLGGGRVRSVRLPGGWSAARPGGGAGWSGLAAAGVVAGESSRARLRRGRGGRAVGPHGSVAGPRLLLFFGVRGCVTGGGGGGLASCRARRKVFNMAAGAPGPLCGGGVGPKLPSPERPTLRARVPHHHLVPRPPGVPGASWGRGAASATGGGEEPPVRSGAAWLSGGGVCKDWGGGHFEDCGAGPGQAAGFLMLARPGGRTLPRGLRAAPLCSRERPGWG